MIDIFLKEDINKLMKSKSIVFMGDSNIRALYKDFLCLLTESKLITDVKLKKKMEPSIFGDKLKFHGEKNNGRDYREEREYMKNNTHVSFYFLTRVYDKYVKAILETIKKRKPDILIINCCLWDVTRWGAGGVDQYKINMQMLLKSLKLSLPDCLVIWITAPPISADLRGGFLVKEIEFLRYSLRFHIMEANQFARKVVVENGFDLLDSHYHLKMQIHRRAGDGIHWLPPAVRYITNLLLTHISLAWNVTLPHRHESSMMGLNLDLVEEEVSTTVAKKEKETVQEENNREIPEPPPKKRKQLPNQRSKPKKTRGRNRKMPNSPCYNPHRNDSGYASPAPYRYTSPWNSPCNFANRRVVQESYTHRRQVHQPYNVQDIPLPYEPYPFHGQNSPFPSAYAQTSQSPYTPGNYQAYVENSPVPYHMENRVPLLREPYSFPHVAPGETLRPIIDFTSDDFYAF